MEIINIILIFSLIITLTLSYLSLLKKRTAMEIVNDMGIGYNLANSFDNYVLYNMEIKINNIEDQLTLYGNPILTKKMIKNIKHKGFKTIRFPVTWMYFMYDNGTINTDWMSRVKEVVNWIINNKMYCILNVHGDAHDSNWLIKYYPKPHDKYINLWSQIAEEFKDYNDYLIFESMDKGYFYNGTYDYDTLLSLTQIFVDTIRNSERYNKERLLLISGMNSLIDYTCNRYYKIPFDPNNKIAISLHYFEPTAFTTFSNIDKWGLSQDYSDIIKNFENLKYYFIDKGIPVILTEIGVSTNSEKEPISVREYLYLVFSLSDEQKGIMPCFWDTSNSSFPNVEEYSLFFFNYFNRETNKWYDKKIENIFDQIIYKKYFKPSNFYIITNTMNIYNENKNVALTANIGEFKILKIILNAYIRGKLENYNYFNLLCNHMDTPWRYAMNFSINKIRKQYDGTYYFFLDVNDDECYSQIIVYQLYNCNLNNLTIEFNNTFRYFDFKAYKSVIISHIN